MNPQDNSFTKDQEKDQENIDNGLNQISENAHIVTESDTKDGSLQSSQTTKDNEGNDQKNNDQSLIIQNSNNPLNHHNTDQNIGLNNQQNSHNDINPHQTANVTVLQWLTYAFWGWTILAVSILSTVVVAYYINDYSVGNEIIYGIAGVLVLLPIATVCDLFYRKKEPAKKVGAASIVMVIHAVIFALFCVASILTIAYSIVSILIATDADKKPYYTAIISALIVAFLYGITLLRTLNSKKFNFIARRFPYIMMVFVGVIALVGIIGPFASSRATRNDEMKSTAIYDVATEIDNQTTSKGSLPTNIEDVKAGAPKEVRDEIIKNGITYKSNFSGLANGYFAGGYSYDVFELCANFDNKSKDTSNQKDTYDYFNLNGAYHDKGNYCFKIKTSPYSKNIKTLQNNNHNATSTDTTLNTTQTTTN